MEKTDRQNLKVLVRGAYDIQRLRIQMGNRIVANFKAKLGQSPGTSEEELDEDAKKLLAKLRRHHALMAEAVLKRRTKKTIFPGDEVISSFTEFCLMDQYIVLEKSEDDHFAKLKKVVSEYPIFSRFLDGVKGCGPAMSGVIISEIDITKSRHPSSIWKYCGLDVAGDGKGRSKKKEHLVKAKYTTKEGTEAEKDSITFNPFIKTKLLGVLGPCFLKAKNEKYSQMYADYKHRLENHATYKDVSKGHRHNMAMRYIVKQFLVELYTKWREIEGLPVSVPYAEAKLGLVHGEEKKVVNG